MTPILALLLLLPLRSESAEFSENSIAPDFTSIAFTRDHILLTVKPRPAWLITGDADDERYFATRRSDYRFHEVSDEEFTAHLSKDHFHRHLGAYDHYEPLREARGLDVSYGSCSADSVRQIGLEYSDLQQTVEVPCGLSILDALRSDDEIWILTASGGSHGRYGHGTLRVFSPTGELIAKISLGETAGSGLVRDPWSDDVWGRYIGAFAVVDREHALKYRYRAIHDFDAQKERPAMFVVDSTQSNGHNPLAVIAYGLGEKTYAKFFRLATDLPQRDDKRILYTYFMGGRFHDPRLPGKLSPLLDSASPTHSWRRFVCMLDNARARDLCTLEFDQWPDAETLGRTEPSHNPANH